MKHLKAKVPAGDAKGGAHNIKESCNSLLGKLRNVVVLINMPLHILVSVVFLGKKTWPMPESGS